MDILSYVLLLALVGIAGYAVLVVRWSQRESRRVRIPLPVRTRRSEKTRRQ